MSYNVRDSNIILGPQAQVELPNGASASTLVGLQIVETAGIFGEVAADLGNPELETVFVAPPSPSSATGLLPLGTYRVVGVSTVFDVASTSGVIDVQKVLNGAADSTGVTMLNATISTAAGARTTINSQLVANINTLTLAAGDRVILKHTGTQTGLVNMSCCVFLVRVV